MTAKQFTADLLKFKKDTELKNVQRYFSFECVESKFYGIRMAKIFEVAKQYMDLPLNEIKKLLDSDYYEIRMGAVSIMDFQARDKKITPGRKKELFDLYISNHSQINNWDMVDRSAPFVVGGYLNDKPRKILHKLAKSKNVWERRTAIVATYFFIRQDDIDDTFKIAEILVNDKHDLIQKAVGSWIREAGKRDKNRLTAFLDKHATAMPKTTLRYAVEKFDKKLKEHYLKQKN
jgi:3-methyladenine DNA glycosylase AlkD